jgi:hypothetical protein
MPRRSLLVGWLAAGQAPGNVPIWDKISVSRIATGVYYTYKTLFYINVEYDMYNIFQCLCCLPHQYLGHVHWYLQNTTWLQLLLPTALNHLTHL